ncbi:MAG: PP2C family protein-serine/threonine phosphatase, partial [Phycisphaerae bacterium]|nr:PP2C family protein-serine/threonine phosphatase [Phycisphaerae bacterium]
SQAAVALQRALLLADRRGKARMEKEMEIARQIQHRMIPQQLPTCPGYDLAASFIPMDEAGGDIYDTIPVQIDTPEEGLILVLADAAGHGLGPALNVSQFRAMVRMGLRCSLDLQSLLGHVDRQLEDDLQDGRFVTAFLGLLELRKNRLEYLSYGQGPLLLFEAASETCRVLTSTDPPLGVSTDLPANSPITCTLEVGDVLVLLTDGYFESSNENGEMFGQPRVAEIVRHRSAEPAQAILDELRSSVWEFCGGTPGDDMTALIVKRTK